MPARNCGCARTGQLTATRATRAARAVTETQSRPGNVGPADKIAPTARGADDERPPFPLRRSLDKESLICGNSPLAVLVTASPPLAALLLGPGSLVAGATVIQAKGGTSLPDRRGVRRHIFDVAELLERLVTARAASATMN